MIGYKFKKYWAVVVWFDLGQYFVHYCDVKDRQAKTFWGIHDDISF